MDESQRSSASLTAVFNGDLVVLNTSTLNDVSASSIDVTRLDSMTSYLSDKLYFGYRSDDSNIHTFHGPSPSGVRSLLVWGHS